MGTKLDEIFRSIDENKDRVLAVLVHLNDTYLIDERPEQGLPGFPRLVSTIRRIRSTVRDIVGRDSTLVLHSGDFLGPSRVGARSKGSVMVKLLDAATLDWCVLGNHEFDYGSDELAQRLKAARFRVTVANATAPRFETASEVLWPTPEAPLVALTGIVSERVFGAFEEEWTFRPAREALAKFASAAALAPFRVVLTHCNREDDRTLRRGLPPRTLLLGGHDHDIDWVEGDPGAPLMKNRANLQTVRVLVLFGGGASTRMIVIEQHDAIYKRRCANAGVPAVLLPGERNPDDPRALKYPQDCDEVLSAVPPVDAAIIKASWGDVDRASLKEPDTLLHLMSRHHGGSDFKQFVLRYEDHESPDSAAQLIVESALQSDPGEDEILRDIPTDPPDGFDVREDSVRSLETPFGSLAAECVRRFAAADVAILNGGSFRADAVLGRTLRLRDVLDTFLYDGADAIVVVDLPAKAVGALIEHGLSQAGSGGYAQFSPRELPVRDSLRLAIVSFLLQSEFDGYAGVLASALGIERAEVGVFVRDNAKARFKFVDALRACVATVPLPAIFGAAVAPKTREDEFIALAKVFVAAGRETGADVYAYEFYHDAALRARCDQRVRLAFQEMQDWVLRLPEVRAVNETRDASPLDELLLIERIKQAHERLGALIQNLEEHRATFEHRADYGYILDNAATDIAAWRVR